MSCFKQIRVALDLFAFHLYCAILHCLLMDLVYSLSHGWGFCLGILVLKGAMEFKMDKHFLLKSSVMSSIEQYCSGGQEEAKKAFRKVLADAELKKQKQKTRSERDRMLRGGTSEGSIKSHSFVVWGRIDGVHCFWSHKPRVRNEPFYWSSGVDLCVVASCVMHSSLCGRILKLFWRGILRVFMKWMIWYIIKVLSFSVDSCDKNLCYTFYHYIDITYILLTYLMNQEHRLEIYQYSFSWIRKYVPSLCIINEWIEESLSSMQLLSGLLCASELSSSNAARKRKP